MERAAPSLVITSGDPAGIGPEIICRSLAEMKPAERAQVVVVGDRAVMERARALVGADLRFGDGPTEDGSIWIDHVPAGNVMPEPGRLSAEAGDAAYRTIVRAVERVRSGGGCIVTAPINKAALNAAGHRFDGHTGLLAHLTGARSSFMLLASERLSTIHVSTHVSLADAIARVTVPRLVDAILAGAEHLRRIGHAEPRIAVAGLNPHCGEHGLFGVEDDAVIVPAVEDARSKGVDVTGPISPDTVFYRASRGEFDLVVAQYHDQGHIPTKLIAFDATVNVSLGLPIDRTSVDHGTAFDLAGTGRASHINMNAALAYGWRLAAVPRAADSMLACA